ncbi:AEC family transporter [Streptomyces sp. WI04-05B]|uniref:AEC family transporter n=1 Tax=Streptomyces TaxID=1883 RepID=UPI0029A98B6E|nr:MULTISPECIES: AEC family transporter [unclassified Streptomyces]MDX2544044.1 AEC family transporter [Streptomyces sp. WI04-05B]MDX2584246.1 AEC family transporter [Streptomyces sp. WI04-05A]MDX3751046.1 AEC family transporter [Streptomyces sp. AK08-02]
MQGVLTGFAVIAVVIGVGYVIGLRGYLGDNGREVLTKLAFHVASPALLFTMLARADLSVIFSSRLLITALSTIAAAGVFVTVGVVRRWGAGPTTIGALCSSYVNSGNLGIPIAVYVLGDASLVAPVLLFQLIMVTPIALTVLDLTSTAEKGPLWRQLITPLRNPIAVGSLAGVLVSATGLTVPAPVMDPLTLIGGMSVPAVLLAFGISLCGSTLPLRGSERAPVLLSVALKSVGQPVAAWALAAGVFGLHGAPLLDVVVTSALPAAQNLFTYAGRYGVAERLARESILLSTILAVPVLVVVATLLG